MAEVIERLQSALAGRYRLDREIGAGGMATVYLAQDVRHDRRVALKLLRPELAAVIGAERFLAEIRLTANLQHPHILPLFDSGEADSYLYYVMPFVEGETLRDRLTREKQLPVAEAVRLASEVASALDYAHRHGVVHRDIKPENILLHDGTALVADFGIALAASKAGGSRMTETGMSLGTPHYMSPEQAMGEREITARSDVYALGAVLYEMLSGEPPFTGNTAQAVVARVLTESPRTLVSQRHTIPQHVEAAVLTALEKLPADRFATAAEFGEALKGRGFTAPGTGAAPAATGAIAATTSMPSTTSTRRAESGGRRWSTGVVAALGLVALAGVGSTLWLSTRKAPAPVVTRYSVFLRPQESLRPSAIAGNIAVSRDGNRIAYVGASEGGSRIWLREHDKLRPTPMPGTEGGVSPFFSPDGNQIGFIVNGRSLRVVSLSGSPPVTLTDSLNATAGDWGTDGYIYVELQEGLGRIRASGGPMEVLFRLNEPKEVGAEYPNVMPDGKGLVFRRRLTGQPANEFEIMQMAIPKGTPQAVMRGVYAHYAMSGHLLVVTSDGKLLAAPFDPVKRALTGPAVAVMDGMLRTGPFELNFAVSDNGTLAYTAGGSASLNRAWWVDRSGVSAPIDTTWDPQGNIGALALSPDGKSLAVTVQRGASADIWVKQLPVGPFSRITFGDTLHIRPSWTADGRSVYYISDAGQGAGTPSQGRADGTGTPHTVLHATPLFAQITSSRDGRWVVLRRSFAEQGNGDLYGLRTGDTTLVPLLTSPAREMSPSLSPDGKWLAYVSDESSQPEVYVRPFPDVATARWQVSSGGGTLPVWARSGRELFYLNSRQELTSVTVASAASLSLGQPKVLFSAAQYLVDGNAGVYDVSPDDKRFVFVRAATGGAGTEMIVVQNWFQELNARVGH
jgi:serine/threonine-protein kinase